MSTKLTGKSGYRLHPIPEYISRVYLEYKVSNIIPDMSFLLIESEFTQATYKFYDAKCAEIVLKDTVGDGRRYEEEKALFPHNGIIGVAIDYIKNTASFYCEDKCFGKLFEIDNTYRSMYISNIGYRESNHNFSVEEHLTKESLVYPKNDIGFGSLMEELKIVQSKTGIYIEDIEKNS